MPDQANVSYASLCRSLSKERIEAYAQDTDADVADSVARYQWNMALAAAVTPVLHLVEVAFRNALYDAGAQTTDGRVRGTRHVASWLDAVPTMLEPAEERDVNEAIVRLGSTRRRTAGHLVGQLNFGFWVRLCNRPYEQGRQAGPRLWPTAARSFPGCPRPLRNRTDIRNAFAEIRDFRNLVAHYQPIWDRDPLASHRRALELLGWMNPSLAAVADEQSSVKTVFDAGPGMYREVSVRALQLKDP
jgi:hypothetical protein